MKKSLALIAAVAALALPISAQAHRAWLAPTATVLSGTDAWVGFDAGMSNGVFIPDHAWSSPRRTARSPSPRT